MALTIPCVTFLFLAASCVIVSGFLTYQEMGEVNHKLPDEKQIPYLFMYPGKMQRIKAEYKRLYPNGRVEFWRMASQLAAFVCAVLTALVSGFLK